MNIVKEFGINGDKRVRYNLIEAKGGRLSDMVGQRIGVKAYVLIEEPDRETGEMRKTLNVLTEDGEVVGTNSRSFIEGFEKFLVCMESDECTEFEVCNARSRAGRTYLTFKA